ncbi:CDP-alcohol phosphatidyltransferase family protein, partial [Gemmatimonas sp.]|uniref:CDP-alcohol phosphatidyltransferase family protein n=1 Tax=Gemmatimonas sp. TaxID=1962908 RepID=UPI0025C0641F
LLWQRPELRSADGLLALGWALMLVATYALFWLALAVAVNALGKLKTIMQMVAIPVLLFHDPLLGLIPVAQIGTLLLYIAAGLTVYSMLYYLKLAWPYLVGRE